MDSKTINKHINAIITPLLKQNGFDHKTGKNYWRHNDTTIDVINFQSFNSYNAQLLGCTTFSFAINLGISVKGLPNHRLEEKDGLWLPKEYECDLRKQLTKSIVQTNPKRKDIWGIAEDGSNLDLVMDDCKKQLEKPAFAWFAQHNTLSKLRTMLLKEGSSVQLAYVEIQLGMFSEAQQHLTEIIAHNDKLIENAQGRHNKDLRAHYMLKKEEALQLLSKI